MEDKHCILSIFGATGDLTGRKLLPALYYLEQENLLPPNFKVICIARSEKSDAHFRKEASDSIRRFPRNRIDEKVLDKLLSRMRYQRLEFQNEDDYGLLREKIESISGRKSMECERIYYLAVPPEYFGMIVNNLKKMNLAGKHGHGPFNRVVFEKPFGSGLRSAKELNAAITKVFDEEQIYRIDHYMAKEIVQNLLALRFANSIFEPLWNKDYIDHIQITVAESIGIEGRGAYYDKAGASRDVIQNHMMHLLTLVTIKEPQNFDGNSIKNEKVKMLKSISPIKKSSPDSFAVLGQYSEGFVEKSNVPAYSREPKVGKDSRTETYVALRLEIRNKMWKGVPFYLRTGKRLKDRSTEIAIVYKPVPFRLFSGYELENNMLVIRVQPYDGITIKFNSKVPGNKALIESADMDFCHECKFGPNTPESYERLLYDVMAGDQTLFTRWDEVENAWKVVDRIMKALRRTKPFMYPAGSWGPVEADMLIEKDGRKWIKPSKPSYADQLGK